MERSKDMNEIKEELDKALDGLIEKSKRTDERLQAIQAAGQALRDGLDAGLLRTQGKWCNRIHCPENKMNWCKKEVCVYGVILISDLTQEPDFAKVEPDFKQVDPHNDAKPSELIQKILKGVEKRL